MKVWTGAVVFLYILLNFVLHWYLFYYLRNKIQAPWPWLSHPCKRLLNTWSILYHMETLAVPASVPYPCCSLCLEFSTLGQCLVFPHGTSRASPPTSMNLFLAFPPLISSKEHTLSLFCFLMYVALCRGGKMLFLCLLRFRDWRTVNYTNRRQVNRRKGICFLIDVYIFMCIGASQIRGG